MGHVCSCVTLHILVHYQRVIAIQLKPIRESIMHEVCTQLGTLKNGIMSAAGFMILQGRLATGCH